MMAVTHWLGWRQAQRSLSFTQTISLCCLAGLLSHKP
jgi:hypothetical protein